MLTDGRGADRCISSALAGVAVELREGSSIRLSALVLWRTRVSSRRRRRVFSQIARYGRRDSLSASHERPTIRVAGPNSWYKMMDCNGPAVPDSGPSGAVPFIFVYILSMTKFAKDIRFGHNLPKTCCPHSIEHHIHPSVQSHKINTQLFHHCRILIDRTAP